MAVSAWAEDSERSNPVKRIRWATQRVTGRKGVEKRKSIFRRHNARASGGAEKKRESAATDPELSKMEAPADGNAEEGAEGGQQAGRTIYFNLPLPDAAKNEEGRPLQHFVRNKIRTAKYTPLSFAPKNLWFQFHNIANVYFLTVIILSVSSLPEACGMRKRC